MYEAALAQGAGFNTVEASDAAEALVILETGAAIDILLTDIDMPGEADGLTLANLVRERWPHIRILVVSAYVDSAGPSAEGICYLHKPFSEGELLSSLLSIV
jgi:CheY-like chemotaxis protein